MEQTTQNQKSKLDIFSERLRKVAEAIKDIQSLGIDEEIFVIWLCYKLKVSKKRAKEIIYHTTDFYDKLIMESTIGQL